MAYSKHMNMIEKLANATEAGALKWKPSVKPDVFQVSFRNNTVRIAEKEGITMSIDGDADVDIQIEILNSDSNIVEIFTDRDLTADNENSKGPAYWYKKMSNLYRNAQRSALGADKVLNDIIADLDEIVPF